MGYEGSHLPNRQTNLDFALSLLFWHFIDTKACHMGRYETSTPATEELFRGFAI